MDGGWSWAAAGAGLAGGGGDHGLHRTHGRAGLAGRLPKLPLTSATPPSRHCLCGRRPADELFIPAGVPHSTKNIASTPSKWFYVSEPAGAAVSALLPPAGRAGLLFVPPGLGAARVCVLLTPKCLLLWKKQGYDGAANSWF